MPYFLDRSLGVPDKETMRAIDEAQQQVDAASDALDCALREIFRLGGNPDELSGWIEELE
jgi:hypothetical protein